MNSTKIAKVLLEFYSDLFSSINTCQPELAMEVIPTIVTDDINKLRLTDFKECEVQEALHQMAPLKSPGLDGMPPLFFQHYWDLVGKDITSFVLHF